MDEGQGPWETSRRRWPRECLAEGWDPTGMRVRGDRSLRVRHAWWQCEQAMDGPRAWSSMLGTSPDCRWEAPPFRSRRGGVSIPAGSLGRGPVPAREGRAIARFRGRPHRVRVPSLASGTSPPFLRSPRCRLDLRFATRALPPRREPGRGRGPAVLPIAFSMRVAARFCASGLELRAARGTSALGRLAWRSQLPARVDPALSPCPLRAEDLLGFNVWAAELDGLVAQARTGDGMDFMSLLHVLQKMSLR